MKRTVCAVLALTLCLLSCLLSSCRNKKTPGEILSDFASAYPLPAGHVYDTTAPDTSDAYFPPELFRLLYARQDGGDDREDVLQCAVFLSTAMDRVAEAGVFVCPDRGAADEVMGMLTTRIRLLRDSAPGGAATDGSPADTSNAGDARIRLFGNRVVYVVLDDNEKAMRVFSRLL